MDTNLLVALIVAPFLFASIAWLVVYSRNQHRKNISQTSIRSNEHPKEKRTD